MALWKKIVQPPLPKRKLGPLNTEAPQENWNLPNPLLQDTPQQKKKKRG